MKFKSKFEIGDILAICPNSLNNLEEIVKSVELLPFHKVREIHVQRCYSETQVFYLTSLLGIRLSKKRFGDSKIVPLIEGALSYVNSNSVNGWMKYREDELEKVNLDQLIEIIKGLKYER